MTDQIQELTAEQERDEAHAALTGILGWISRYGRIANHGHRRPNSACAECIVLNNAMECLQRSADAVTRKTRIEAARQAAGTKIIVNGKECVTHFTRLAFTDVLNLAEQDHHDTITYRYAAGDGHILSRGQTASVAPGMVFNTANTSRA